jgi:hypothetical protein
MFTRNLPKLILTIAALVGISCLAVAQNMGGGGMSPPMPMPGMPTAPTVPGMHPGSGMNGAAVAGAMGGVVAGAGLFYLFITITPPFWVVLAMTDKCKSMKRMVRPTG